jgi:hypothetical protein
LNLVQPGVQVILASTMTGVCHLGRLLEPQLKTKTDCSLLLSSPFRLEALGVDLADLLMAIPSHLENSAHDNTHKHIQILTYEKQQIVSSRQVF